MGTLFHDLYQYKCLTDNDSKKKQATLEYLNFIDSSRHFSSSILKIFIEDRRTVHADRINNNRIIGVLQTGNIVMVRTVIHSDISKNKVSNLSYAVRGPCRIIRSIRRSRYFFKKLNKADSPEFKFIAYDLYSLPPFLKPCGPINTADRRYLNHSRIPSINLFKRYYTSNYITRNNLTNHLTVLAHYFLINMIFFGFLMNPTTCTAQIICTPAK